MNCTPRLCLHRVSLRSAALAAVCSGAVLVTPKAHAQVFIWDGGSASSSNWSDIANWSGGLPTSSYANEIRMQGANRKTNTNNLGTLKMGRLLLDGSNWYLSGNAFEFQGGGKIDTTGSNNIISNNLILNTAANNDRETKVSVGAGNNLTLSGNISGTGTIAMVSSGLLNLNGTNTNTGGLTAYFGTVNAATSALGGPLNILGPATLNWNVASNANWNKSISGSGLINKTGAGNLTLSGANTFAGHWQISNGAIVATDTASLGLSSVIFDSLGSATMYFTNATDQTYYGGFTSTANGGSPNHTIFAQGSGVLTLLGDIQDNVQLIVNVGSSVKTTGFGMTDRMTIYNGGKLEVNIEDGDVFNLKGELSNSGQFIKTGSGLLNWTKAMTNFTGSVDHQLGQINVDADDFTQKMTIGHDAWLDMGDGIFNGQVAGTGTVRKADPGVLDFTKSQTGFAGTLLLTSGQTLIKDGSVGTGKVNVGTYADLDYKSTGNVSPQFRLVGSGTVNFSNSGGTTRLLNGTEKFTGDMNINGGALFMTTNNFAGRANISSGRSFGLDQDFSGVFGGRLFGDGTFIKTGSGEATVLGSSITGYTGNIQVEKGALRLKDADYQQKAFVYNGSSLIYDTSTNRDLLGTYNIYDGKFIKDGYGTLSVTDKIIAALEIDKGTVYVKPGTLTADVLNVNQMGRLRLGGELSSVNTTQLSNGGEVSGTGRISGKVINGELGRIVVGGNDTMQLQGDVDNYGAIQMTGGTLQVESKLTNAAGSQISGRGVLRTAGSIYGTGLYNQGAVSFSGGYSDVFGDVANQAGGQILTVGGGTTTFHDDVVHNGAEIRTAAGSRSVFLGGLSGAGNFTGTGTVEIQGDLRPGNSPAHVTFGGDLELGETATTTMELGGLIKGAQYDSITVLGTANLGGALDVKFYNGFSSNYGDTFQLFSGNLVGTFDSVSLPTLQGGLYWDTTKLYSDGKIQTVPEPASLAVIGIGVVSILKRRKKNSK